jgi:hypothetical protein
MVKGDWQNESQFSLTIYMILVVVKGDWRKESQFSPTTQVFLFWLKGIGKMNLSLA